MAFRSGTVCTCYNIEFSGVLTTPEAMVYMKEKRSKGVFGHGVTKVVQESVIDFNRPCYVENTASLF